jgi:thioredoxin reductase (NADPH)
MLDFDLKKVQGKENIVPFLVLGSGPASLSAALYGARAKIMTVVLRGNKPGGQLTGTSYIENWPGVGRVRGTEVMQDLKEQAASFGAVMVDDVAESIDFSQWPYKVTTEEGNVLYALALMVGTGSTPKRLYVPGEDTYWGRGVTTCAICDAPYHKGDHVVVVGGGDSAMEEAIELAAYAAKVSVLVRTDTAKASPSMIERALSSKNVEILYSKAIAEIHGDNEHVTSVDIIDTKTKEIVNTPIRGVFLGIGHDPNTSLVKGVLECTESGNIRIGAKNQWTSQTGVVAAGDVSDDRYKQAGVAAGDGIKAGLDVVWWLSELGYNNQFQEQLEPYFFTLKGSHKVELEEIESLQEYEDIVADAQDSVVILDFFTPYCPSCMHMIPVIEWVVSKFDGKVVCYKVDASMAFDLVKTFNVPDVPYLVFIKNGKIVGKVKKEMNRAELYGYLKKLIEKK